MKSKRQVASSNAVGSSRKEGSSARRYGELAARFAELVDRYPSGDPSSDAPVGAGASAAPERAPSAAAEDLRNALHAIAMTLAVGRAEPAMYGDAEIQERLDQCLARAVDAAERITSGASGAPLSHSGARAVPAGMRCRHILVVDDEADSREPLCEWLALLGYEAVAVAGGCEALEHLRSAPCDLVICDLSMPGMSGWETARAIRDIAPATPVYLLTGAAPEIPMDSPSRALVDGVLAKPVDPERLRAILDFGFAEDAQLSSLC